MRLTDPNETKQEKHRRIQRNIRSGKTAASRDTRTRLKVRSNKFFDQGGVTEEGRNFTRRNPKLPFRPPSRKPATGAKITHRGKGRMLKAIKIAEQKYAGKSLRTYFSGFGYQLRVAEAQRKMQELTLPEIQKNRRIKNKDGSITLVVDPRRRQAELTLRRLKKVLDAIDQWIYPLLGAHPVEKDHSKIPFICLGDSDEEANKRAHPEGWMGKMIRNSPIDSAKSLACLLNFLMPADRLGNMPGDAVRYDEVGIMKIIKEEPESEPELSTDKDDGGNVENEPSNSSSNDEDAETVEAVEAEGNDTMEIAAGEDVREDTVEPEVVAEPEVIAEPEVVADDNVRANTIEPEVKETAEAKTNEPETDSDIEVIDVIEIKSKSKPKTRKIKMELEGGSDVEIVNRIPKKEIKCEGDAPIPSTSTQHLIPASIGQVPGQIEIDWSALSQQLFQHLRATAEGPEKSNV